MAREQWDVAQSVAQRRQRDREDVEAVKKVGAEFALVDQSLKRLIGGGYDADFYADALRAAQPFEDAGLQHAQEPPLYLQRNLSYLIQKDRAAVGQLESPRLGRLRAGDSALFVAEQLALDQRGRKRRAVDYNEGASVAQAALVNGVGEQLLPSPRLSLQQNGRIGRGDVQRVFEHPPIGRAVADQLAHRFIFIGEAILIDAQTNRLTRLLLAALSQIDGRLRPICRQQKPAHLVRC